MKLIVAEVIWERPAHWMMGMADPKPEGATWYGDAKVMVKTRPNTPRWVNRLHHSRRRLASR
jgi:hypothetical protein